MRITKAEFLKSGTNKSHFPTSGEPEFLFLGRSNVGKSSFINTLVNRKNYARTSSTPGKTQTINFYLVNDEFYLVDAPGYGYAQVDREKQQKFGMMIEEYLINRENLKRVFLLVDYRHKPTEDDELMFNFLKYYNLDVTIVATKYDKVKQKDRDKVDKALEESFTLKENDNIVLFSSVTKKGREELYSIIEGCLK